MIWGGGGGGGWAWPLPVSKIIRVTYEVRKLD